MNLLQLRTKFREISGRFDLVNDDYSDNGADFFLNEGRKFLDRLDETQKSWASIFRFVEIGFYAATFPYCRAIKEVWAATSSARWQLEKKSLQDLIAGYLTGLPSSRSLGAPAYYSPGITRYIPENATADTFESFIGWVEIPSGNAHEFNSVILNVPVEEKVVLEIKGLFYSADLVNDTDENYWSAVHPLLLIMAAMRQIEIVNRNTQGVNDWTVSIGTEMKQLGMDLVEELIAEVTQIED
uniref:Uncharacterized protein n=1 Tax=viral metagenome TaxID=1070528 RepID=A0A6M3JVI9_9ZZZZ